MRALRWMLPAIAIALFPLACATEGEEAGEETTIIEDDDPDFIIEDREPDVIVDDREDGFEAEIDVDEDGKLKGEVRVEDK